MRWIVLFFLLGMVSPLYAVRIVSLVPSVTYNLQLLGVDADIVGRTSYCPGAKPDGSNVVGSVIEVNVEKIVALKPDVVFAMELTRSDVLQTLRKMSLKVVVYPTPDGFEQICSQLQDMGARVGRRADANQIVAAQKELVAKLRERVEKGRVGKVFFEIGAKPLFAVLPGTFMNDYITLMGGQNIISTYKGGSVSREFVLEQNPDVIVITDMGLVGSDEARQWHTFKQLSAVKHNRVWVVNADEACCPTPVFFTRTLSTLIDLWNESH